MANLDSAAVTASTEYSFPRFKSSIAFVSPNKTWSVMFRAGNPDSGSVVELNSRVVGNTDHHINIDPAGGVFIISVLRIEGRASHIAILAHWPRKTIIMVLACSRLGWLHPRKVTCRYGLDTDPSTPLEWNGQGSALSLVLWNIRCSWFSSSALRVSITNHTAFLQLRQGDFASPQYILCGASGYVWCMYHSHAPQWPHNNIEHRVTTTRICVCDA